MRPTFKVLLLMSLLPAAIATAGPSLKKQALEQAALVISRDPQVKQLKSDGSMAFRKPRVKINEALTTVEFSQLYLETLPSLRKRLWFVPGGRILAQKWSSRSNWIVSKQILGVNSFNFEELIPEQRIFEKMSRDLKIPFSIDSKYAELSHKIIDGNPVYEVVLSRKALSSQHGRVLVYDAKTGEILRNYSRQTRLEDPARHNIEILDAAFHVMRTNKYSDPDQLPKDKATWKLACQLISTSKKAKGEPLLIQPHNCEIGHDESAQRAFRNMNIVLDYFWMAHKQWGFDNDPTGNTKVTSIVHIGDHFDNAYWSEEDKFMVYGDGSGGHDRDSTNDYTLALDIAGHEFTHAIVSNTANFSGPSDPGALNEAFADIFGILISRASNPNSHWTIGAKLYNNADGDSDEIALRSLANPSQFKTSTYINGKLVQVPFPEKYSQRLAQRQKCNDDNDQCEVHANSTIWSHGAYLFNKNLQDHIGLSAVDADRMTGTIYFLTLAHELSENDSMPKAASLLLKTCNNSQAESVCLELTAALAEVELLP